MCFVRLPCRFFQMGPRDLRRAPDHSLHSSVVESTTCVFTSTRSQDQPHPEAPLFLHQGVVLHRKIDRSAFMTGTYPP